MTSLINGARGHNVERLAKKRVVGEFGLTLEAVKMLVAQQTNVDGEVWYEPYPGFRFLMRLENGHFNSASLDRENNKLGYITAASTDEAPPNLSVVPGCLQNLKSIKQRHWPIVAARLHTPIADAEVAWLWGEIVKPRSFVGVKDLTKVGVVPLAKIWQVAQNAETSAKRSIRKKFEFADPDEFGHHFIEVIIEQGFRCLDSGMPFNFRDKNSPFAPSPDRRNPNGVYKRGNIGAVCVCVQTSPGKRFLNQNLTAEERAESLRLKTTPKSYWDEGFGNVGAAGEALEADRMRVRDMIRRMSAEEG